MKKIIGTILTILVIQAATAQPDAFKYQAVLRDQNGMILSDQDISLRLSLINNGTAAYTETHDVKTNKFGLVNLEIGAGITSDSLGAVNWGAGDYSLKIEMDAYGGTSYTVLGVSPILSVPFALYAKESENIKLTEQQMLELEGDPGPKGDPGDPRAKIMSQTELSLYEHPDTGTIVLQKPDNYLFIYNGDQWIRFQPGDAKPFIVSAGEDQYICSGNVVQLNAPDLRENETGTWSVQQTGPGEMGVFDDITDPGTSFTSFYTNQYNTFTWTVVRTNESNGKVESESDQASAWFFLDDNIKFPEDSVFGTIQGIPVRMGGEDYPGTSSDYSILSGAEGAIRQTEQGTLLIGKVGEIYGIRGRTNSTCGEFSDTVFAQILVDAGRDREVCYDTVHLQAQLAPGVTGQWITSDGGSFEDNNDPNTVYTKDPQNNEVMLQFRVRHNNTQYIDEMHISFLTTELKDDTLVYYDRSFCRLPEIVGSNISWEIISGENGSVSALYTFSGNRNEIYTLRANWENNCGSYNEDLVIAFIDTWPEWPSYSCSDTVVLNAPVPPEDVTGTWKDPEDFGYFEDPTNPSTRFIRTRKNYLYTPLEWEVAFGSFKVSRNSGIPFEILNVSAGVDMPDHLGNEIALNASPANGTWTIVSGDGGLLSDINDPGAVFSGDYGEEYILGWEGHGSYCSGYDEMTVSFKDPSSIPGVYNGKFLIPDANFRTSLQTLIPMAFDGDSLIIEHETVTSLRTIYVSDTDSLNGVEFFSNLNTLSVSNYDMHKLRKLERLPNSISELSAGGNLISYIDKLPTNLRVLSIGENRLTSLPPLPDHLYRLICYYNLLTDLPELPDGLTDLTCFGNQITSLPDLPNNIKNVDCSDNEITGLPELPESMTHLWVNDNPGLSILPELPDGMCELKIANTGITCMPNIPADPVCNYFSVDIILPLCE